MMLELESLLKKYGVKPNGVIQIGSHFFQEKEVFQRIGISNFALIEPQAHAFQITKDRSSDLSNCQLFKCAISDNEGDMTLYCDNANEGQSSSLLKADKHLETYPHIIFEREEIVSVKTLDSLGLYTYDYDLIVIDVQGNELRALQGGLVTLQKINVIYTEVNFIENYHGCCLVSQLDEFLKLQGFTRVETGIDAGGWSDAFYIRDSLLKNIILPEIDYTSLFNETDYLELNPDVADAVNKQIFSTGKDHYDRFGRSEGRKTFILKGEPRINRAYVTEIPEIFNLIDESPYPLTSKLEFERYFCQRLIEENPEGLNRKLLPIAWSAYYKANKNDFNRMADLQRLIYSLDRKEKYFTICNYPEGILSDISMLDIVVYSGSKYKDEYYSIPLIHDSQDILIEGSAKTTLFSFVGSNTNDIRVKLKEKYPNEVKLGFDRQEFIKQINTSKFTLCPRGKSESTFRIFEALMCGSIPVYISDKFIEPFNIDFENYGIKLYPENLKSLSALSDDLSDYNFIHRLTENGKSMFDKYFTYEGCYEQILQTLIPE